MEMPTFTGQSDGIDARSAAEGEGCWRLCAASDVQHSQFLSSFLQVKYKEDVQKQLQSSLFSGLPQTPQTELAKEVSALQSEVMCVLFFH